jgi:Protein of unknown function, DUF488
MSDGDSVRLRSRPLAYERVAGGARHRDAAGASGCCTAAATRTLRAVKPPISNHLYTLGYEGLDIETFVTRVKAVGVKTVVDVRELPLSRKKGFSKSSFRDALAAAGVAYFHVPALGCPRPIRDRFKTDSDWAAYTRAFLAYISTQETTVQELVKLSKATTACLVCFEADYTICHRTYVARAARKLGGPSVMHLTARTALPDGGLQAVA